MGGGPDFQRLFEAAPDVLLVLLPDAPRFTMVAATEARLAATHTTLEQTIGKGLFELFPDNPDDPSATGTRQLRASLDRVLATRAPDSMAVQKYDIRGPDGSFLVKYWSPKNLPVLSPKGEVLYILHRVEDVTELVRASEEGEVLRDRSRDMEREVIRRSQELAAAIVELRSANAKLGELDTAKTTFFSNVSHEFRTPLTLMLGPLEDALADQQELLGKAQRTRVSLAYDNALRLLKLVNSLLDFSRLEAGRIQASFAPTDLAAATTDLAWMFDSAVEKANLKLVVECPPLSEQAWVDQEMWEKIVPNLVSNAFKYTMAGKINVRLTETTSAFVLEVADTGAGIPESELPKIFERFHRVAGAISRTHEGTGIGLSLVRDLVQLHGGQLSVESTVGQGSTFRVEIPKGFSHLPPKSVNKQPVARVTGREGLAYRTEAARWAGSSAPAPGAVPDPVTARNDVPRVAAAAPAGRVLVADDNPDLRRYIAGLLSPLYDVTVAEDGLAALEQVRRQRPDLVVTDVMMPKLDGLGLLKELRDDPVTATIPVLMLSARAGEEAAVEGLAAGADDYLAKPFSARELLARVRTHFDLALARRRFTDELEQTNHELDAFSYSVSHDLRAPLRAIDGFSHILLEDYAGVLDERGKEYLDRVSTSAQRMSGLIDDLLGLARVSRAQLRTTSVDLSAFAAQLVADLRRANPERKVEVEIDEGLVTEGDRGLLGVLLTNLIGNAWKFTARVSDARLRIGATAPGTFFVRDNGAGFDMAYAAKLFAPFQRLHAANEFEGTGIGLATSQRVVRRHGGKIWAEAELGKGATFFFSLPQT